MSRWENRLAQLMQRALVAALKGQSPTLEELGITLPKGTVYPQKVHQLIIEKQPGKDVRVLLKGRRQPLDLLVILHAVLGEYPPPLKKWLRQTRKHALVDLLLEAAGEVTQRLYNVRRPAEPPPFRIYERDATLRKHKRKKAP